MYDYRPLHVIVVCLQFVRLLDVVCTFLYCDENASVVSDFVQ